MVFFFIVHYYVLFLKFVKVREKEVGLLISKLNTHFILGKAKKHWKYLCHPVLRMETAASRESLIFQIQMYF